MFAKTTLAKSNKILELLKHTTNVEYIVKQVKSFTSERRRELSLLAQIVRQNVSLQKRIGKRQLKTALQNYTKKIYEIENFFKDMLKIYDEIEKIKYRAKLCVLGTYTNSAKDRIRWEQDVKREKELLNEYAEKINAFYKRIKKAIRRVIVALKEKMLYLIETKYVTTKRIIYKVHYDCDGKFLGISKLYDKDSIEVLRIRDKAIMERYLKMQGVAIENILC